MIKSKIGPIEEEIEEAKDSANVLYNVLERLKKIIEEGNYKHREILYYSHSAAEHAESLKRILYIISTKVRRYIPLGVTSFGDIDVLMAKAGKIVYNFDEIIRLWDKFAAEDIINELYRVTINSLRDVEEIRRGLNTMIGDYYRPWET